ncbi:hypothetical protein [Flavobacterium sp.]|uniref:hypothetical protein n=1 Tax=Flavobacterium sp. TaxID=239 RepID=UPI00286E2605|nr:hypothetical protein [Flavobacterium sp.]
MLIVATQWSCAVEDSVKEADKAAAATSNFVIEPTMNYFINGTLTYDYDAVKVAAKDAWNIHFDGSTNKVVISTTPDEFEKYIKSNGELEKALADNDRAAAENEILERQNSLLRFTVPPGAPASFIPAFADISVIGFNFRKIIAGGAELSESGIFSASSDSDISTKTIKQYSINESTGAVLIDAAQNNNYNLASILLSDVGNVYGFAFYMNNESKVNTLTKTFYEGINYTGLSTTFTCAKNSNSNLTSLRKPAGIKSYK